MLWGGSFFKPKDSSGRESRTLFFVSITCIILWFCMLATMVVFVHPLFTAEPLRFSVNEFATAESILAGLLTTVIGIWLGRDWVKDHFSWKTMELQSRMQPPPPAEKTE